MYHLIGLVNILFTGELVWALRHTVYFINCIIISWLFIDLEPPHPNQTHMFLPLINVTLLYALSATLESFAEHTLTGARAPTAPFTERVTNVPLCL